MHLQPVAGSAARRGAEGRAGCAGRGGGPGTAPLTGTQLYANAHVLPAPRWAAPGEARSPRYAGKALGARPGSEGRADTGCGRYIPTPPCCQPLLAPGKLFL